jgi:hypothetical protein
VDGAGAAELLRHRAPDLAPPVAAAIAQAAAGNPLALAELPATLSAEQRAGAAALELPLAPEPFATGAHEAGALATLSGALFVAADVAFRFGDWETADERTLEAIRIAGETGQPALHGFALSTPRRAHTPGAAR